MMHQRTDAIQPRTTWARGVLFEPQHQPQHHVHAQEIGTDLALGVRPLLVSSSDGVHVCLTRDHADRRRERDKDVDIDAINRGLIVSNTALG